MKESGCEVPEWMLELKNTSKNQRKELKKGIKRDDFKTVTKYDEIKRKRKQQMVEDSIKKHKHD